MTMPAMQFQCVSAVSGTELVCFIAAGLLALGIQAVLQRKYGWDARKARSVAMLIILGAVIVLAVITEAAGD